MILDVAGAAAQMAVECFRDGGLEIDARHRLPDKPLQKDLALVEEAGGAIAALEREVLDEGLLQGRELVAPGVTFDGADRLAVEICRRDHARRAGGAGPVGVVDDDGAAQALGGAAAELGAGEPQVFAQEVVHRQLVAHLGWTVGAAVDGQCQRCHASAPLRIFWVTGRDWKRWPVASKMALRSAGTTGIITTSAMPFGGSSGVNGGSISISRSRSGRSEPRAIRYWPRFHCPLPGPPS